MAVATINHRGPRENSTAYSTMLEKLIDFLLDIIRSFQFAKVLMQYERGVVLRWGRFHRMAEPGVVWFWPFFIESVDKDSVVLDTMRLEPQSLIARDGHQIVIRVMVSFRIEDIKTFLLEVEGRDEALRDMTYGAVAGYVAESENLPQDINNRLSILVRRRAKRFGIAIEEVQVVDFALARSFRIFGDQKVLADRAGL